MTLTTKQRDTDAAPVSRIAKWAPLAVILTGTFVYILDFFVVNVALPDIQGSLHASSAAIEWLVSGYALTSASLLVCGGRLGDHYGRRRCFCIGLAAFVLASALCALATDPGFLIAARLVQGAGGAIMAPNIMSILGLTYTGRDRVRAISVYGMVMGIAAVGGQLIGGVLIDANVAGLGWRAIFWVNVPIGLVALAAARKLVPQARAAHAGHLDLPGAALLAAGLVAIVLPLADGRQQGWPAWSWACLALGPVLLALFAGYLRRTGRHGRQPLLDPAVFAGQGLCITPLTTTVLAHADARTAGSISGALSTAQQVGNAIGVAVSGVIFFGLLSHGFAAAFGTSLAQMGGLLLVVAALTLTLLRPSSATAKG
jgi:MFS family permease